uniref:Uncharacterized protein n=1 Tax=uncultured Dehalococcoidia bacterium TaxID=498747 RepID=A0A871YCC2_9CHLR|nr:hypothetical protein HULAa30F3_00032 [uncultured Dehalococcoidia bacterium]
MRKLIRHVFYVVLCLLLLAGFAPVNPVPAQAASISDYYTYSYTADFSKTEVLPAESFDMTISGQATCIAPLKIGTVTITPSAVEVAGQIIATNTATGAQSVLNPSYQLTISPVPSSPGQSTTASVTMTLALPSDSAPGTYQISGKLDSAKVIVGPLPMDVTSLMPSSQAFGSITCKSASIGGGGAPPTSSTPAPTATPSPSPTQATIQSTVNISGFISAEGIFNTSVRVLSQDRKCTLDISKNVQVQTAGAPLTTLNMTESAAALPLPQNSGLASPLYELGPAGTSFNPAIILTIMYNLPLPAGVTENSLSIRTWDPVMQRWIAYTSTVNTQDKTVSAAIPHFSTFAVIGDVQSAPAPSATPSVTPSPTITPVPSVTPSPTPTPSVTSSPSPKETTAVLTATPGTSLSPAVTTTTPPPTPTQPASSQIWGWLGAVFVGIAAIIGLLYWGLKRKK